MSRAEQPQVVVASSSDVVTWILLVAAAGAFAWLVAAARPFTVDDAFIVLRYAQNLANGHGPTFNADGPPVEGVTSFPWLLLLTLPHLLGIDAALFAKVAGVVATLGIGYEVGATAVGCARGGAVRPALVGAAAVLCFAALPMTAVHAVSGLETAPFTWLLLALLRAVGPVGDPLPNGWRIGALALCLGLARPEGNLAAALVIGARACQSVPAMRWRWLRQIALVYVLPGAAYFLARWAYYGHPLPLPFYVKVHDPEAFVADAVGGWQVLRGLLAYLGPVSLAAFAVGVLVRGLRRWPLLLAVSGLAAAAATTPDIMGYEWRYFFPVVAASVPFAAIGICTAVAAAARSLLPERRHERGNDMLVAVAPLALAATFLWTAPARLVSWQAYAQGLAGAHLPLGRELAGLRGLVPSPKLLIADAGAVPYMSAWHTFDSFGLNEPEIAVSGRHDVEVMLAAQPDVVVLISTRADRFLAELPWEQDLYDLAMQRGFELAQRLRFSATYFLWVLCAPASPFVAPLRAWQPDAAVAGDVLPTHAPSTEGCVRHELAARYPGGLVVEAAHLRADLLVVDVHADRRQTRSPKFFVHVYAPGAASGPIVRQDDFAPVPAFTGLRVGRTVQCWTTLQPPLEPGAVLRIGLFDERDPALAPWVDANGRAVFELVVR